MTSTKESPQPFDLAHLWNWNLPDDVPGRAYAEALRPGVVLPAPTGSANVAIEEVRAWLPEPARSLSKALAPGRWLAWLYAAAAREGWYLDTLHCLVTERVSTAIEAEVSDA